MANTLKHTNAGLTQAASSEITSTARIFVTTGVGTSPVTKYLDGETLKEVIRDEFGDVFLTAGTGISVNHDDAGNTFTISVTGVLDDFMTLGAPASDGQFIVATGPGAFAYESGATVRSSLGLVIGTNVQAWDANLDQLAALTPASSLIIGNGLGGYEMVTPANFITNNNILGTADIGSAVQAYDADLAEIAALNPTANQMIYVNGGTAWATTSLTTFARTLLDDANAAAARTTLGVDAAGTDNSTDVTLAGAYNYLTIAGQVITLAQIDLTTDVTGALPDGNIATATNWNAAYTHSQVTSGNPHSVTKSDVGLGNVENTALSTWAGSANITTLGTIGTGVWQGTAIDSAYIDPTLSVTSVTAGTLSLASGSITDSSGAISFGNENLSGSGDWYTTGRLGAGRAPVSANAIIEAYQSGGQAGIYSTDGTEWIGFRVSGGATTGAIVRKAGSTFNIWRYSTYPTTGFVGTDLEIDGSGNFDFQAGNITTTGTLASGKHTVAVVAGENMVLQKQNDSPALFFNTWAGAVQQYFESGTAGIGIGITPSYKLDVNGTGRFIGALTVESTFASGNATVTGTGLIGSSLPGSPDGTLHVHTATAGVVTAAAGADDIVVENSAEAGITVLTPDANVGYLIFGSPTDATGAWVSWQHSALTFKAGSQTAGASTILTSGNGTTALTLDSSQNATFAGDVTLGASSTTASKRLYFPDTGGNEWLIEYSSGGLQFGEFGVATRLTLPDGGGLTVPTGDLTLSAGDLTVASTYKLESGSNYFMPVSAGGGLQIYQASTSADMLIASGRNIIFSDQSFSEFSRFDSSGNLLLGSTSTSNNAQFYAKKTYSNASGTDVQGYFYPTQGVATTGDLRAVYAAAEASHTSGSVALLHGVYGQAFVNGAGGTTSDAIALRANIRNDNASATITRAYGLYINAFTATGTITNRWGIYQAGASENNYLAGDLRIGTTSAAGNEILRVNGLIHSDSDSIIVDTAKTPASAAATGTQGQIAWDADYIYVCTATDTWKRAAILTWV